MKEELNYNPDHREAWSMWVCMSCGEHGQLGFPCRSCGVENWGFMDAGIHQVLSMKVAEQTGKLTEKDKEIERLEKALYEMEGELNGYENAERMKLNPD